MRAGVREVLALQEHAHVVPRTIRQRLRRYLEQRRRTADEITLKAGQLVAVRGVAPGCRPRGGQLVERRDQRLGNESAAIRAEPTAAIHPVGTGRLASRRPDEGEDAPGIRRAGALKPGCGVDPGRTRGTHHTSDIRRFEAAGQANREDPVEAARDVDWRGCPHAAALGGGRSLQEKVRRPGRQPRLRDAQRRAHERRLVDDADHGGETARALGQPRRRLIEPGQLDARRCSANFRKSVHRLVHLGRLGTAEDQHGADRAKAGSEPCGGVGLDAPPAVGRHDEAHEVRIGGHRCSDAGRVALPADLHGGAARMRRHGDWGAPWGSGYEITQAPGRVRGLEQRRADERGVRACGGDVGEVGVVGDAALGDQRRASPLRRPQQVEDAIARDLEGVEVARIDADERRVSREGPMELGLVVNLDERVDPRLGRGLEAPAQLLVGQGTHDEQDRTGAEGPRLPDLDRIDSEVLAQHRRAEMSGFRKVVVGPAEARRLGQDREGGCSGVGVAARQGGHGPRSTGHRCELPGRGGSPLHLGDDRQAVRIAERRFEARGRRH